MDNSVLKREMTVWVHLTVHVILCLSEEEILFILHMWNRKMLFPNLLFPLCVFGCIGREECLVYITFAT